MTLLVLSMACRSPSTPSFTPQHQVALSDSVRNVMSELATNVSRTGFTAWIPCLERSERFVWTADGKIEFPTADSLARFIEPFAATLSHTELAFADLRVSPLAPGVAQAAATYREMFVGRQADTTRVAGVFVGVWVRSSGAW